jgi:hypothetical protein
MNDGSPKPNDDKEKQTMVKKRLMAIPDGVKKRGHARAVRLTCQGTRRLCPDPLRVCLNLPGGKGEHGEFQKLKIEQA